MAQGRPAAIAYLTIVQDDRTGWTGGLLVLGVGGRPLEFQCTLPVRPSRTHEILFGSSLRGHLISEIIAPVLVEKCRTPIGLLCCDQPEVFRLGDTSVFPIGLVRQAAQVEEGPIDADTLPQCETVELAGSLIDVPMERHEGALSIVNELADIPDAIEPFERIREAIREAQAQIAAAASANMTPQRFSQSRAA
ncbi:MAG: hypothetical protein AAF664_04980 [Planctomycetota bacterium]